MPARVLESSSRTSSSKDDVVVSTRRASRLRRLDGADAASAAASQGRAVRPAHAVARRTRDMVFDQIKDGDLLLHHPFDSFSAVETFLDAAVDDPQVVAIKMTLYRIGSNSPLVDRLIDAAERGQTGRRAGRAEGALRRAEQHRVGDAAGRRRRHTWSTGVVNLKTHCKLCLVVRKEGEGIQRYVHVGTGNYNRATAQVYTDLGLFTANAADRRGCLGPVQLPHRLFAQTEYRELWSHRSGCAQRFRRWSSAKWRTRAAGRPAGIVIKNNAISDPGIIQLLYRASAPASASTRSCGESAVSGRAFPGVSDLIEVRSIVGRFLEHSRIYSFENGGNRSLYRQRRFDGAESRSPCGGSLPDPGSGDLQVHRSSPAEDVLARRQQSHSSAGGRTIRAGP